MLPHYIPLMLNCTGRRCVVVGGGEVAARKAAALIAASADTIVISPSLAPHLMACYEKGQMKWNNRNYREGDLKGAYLVYAATDKEEVNAAVVKEAEGWGILVNDTSDGMRGTFITPASFRRGGLIVAVSTSGAGPLVSRKLCREVDAAFGDHYEAYIDFLSRVRGQIKDRVHDAERRKSLYRSLAEMDILAQIREGCFRPWSDDELASWIEAEQEERE